MLFFENKRNFTYTTLFDMTPNCHFFQKKLETSDNFGIFTQQVLFLDYKTNTKKAWQFGVMDCNTDMGYWSVYIPVSPTSSDSPCSRPEYFRLWYFSPMIGPNKAARAPASLRSACSPKLCSQKNRAQFFLFYFVFSWTIKLVFHTYTAPSHNIVWFS